MLYVCLTYDYELFMGKNKGTYDEILFEPTADIAKVMSDNGVNGTFFVDTCSAMAFKNAGGSNLDYYLKFTEQIKKLAKMGNDIQMHIHTSWLKADFNANGATLSSDGYDIHQFGFNPDDDSSAFNIIKRSKEYLNKEIGSVSQDYNCVAYRAGGFMVQPEKELFYALIKNGIKIDSSIVPGLASKDTANRFDFSKTPKMLNWKIDPDVGLHKASEKDENVIIEIPIASARPRPIECIGKSGKDLRLPPTKPKGEYVSTGQVKKRRNRIETLYHRLLDYRYISLDTRNYKAVYRDLEFIYKKYSMEKHDGIVALIAHPKLSDEFRCENLSNLIQLLKAHKEKYCIETISNWYKREGENLI